MLNRHKLAAIDPAMTARAVMDRLYNMTCGFSGPNTLDVMVLCEDEDDDEEEEEVDADEDVLSPEEEISARSALAGKDEAFDSCHVRNICQL